MRCLNWTMTFCCRSMGMARRETSSKIRYPRKLRFSPPSAVRTEGNADGGERDVPIPTRSWFFLEKKRKVMWRAKCRKWTHFSFGSVLRVTQSSQPGCKWVKCMRTGYPSLAFVRTAARVIGLYDTCYAGSTRWLCALIIIIIHDCSGVPRVFNLWRDLYRRTLLEVHLAQRMGCREPPFSLLLTDVVRQKWQL